MDDKHARYIHSLYSVCLPYYIYETFPIIHLPPSPPPLHLPPPPPPFSFQHRTRRNITRRPDMSAQAHIASLLNERCVCACVCVCVYCMHVYTVCMCVSLYMAKYTVVCMCVCAYVPVSQTAA